MQIHLGTDHAGFEFKETLKAHLTDSGHEVIDHGALEFDALDDYPSFCIAAAEAVVAARADGTDALGVVIGGSGNGEQMAATRSPAPAVRSPGTRRSRSWPVSTTTRGSCPSVRVQHEEADSIAIVDAFIATPYSDDERHNRRIGQIAAYESR